MPYSAEHKQETRNRIVRNARKLFNRHGFAEVSIDQIMASAGLTRGGFYNHFQTKDELYVEAMDRYAADQMAEMSARPSNLAGNPGSEDARQQSLALAATCIGAMVLARTVADKELAAEICGAAHELAAQCTLSRKGLAA